MKHRDEKPQKYGLAPKKRTRRRVTRPLGLWVAGSRDSDHELPAWVLDFIAAVKENGGDIIHGGCPTGVDAMVSKACKDMGAEEVVFPADWKKHGRAAGPIRNAEMARVSSLLIAMPGGRGTESAIREAKKMGTPVLKVEPSSGEGSYEQGFADGRSQSWGALGQIQMETIKWQRHNFPDRDHRDPIMGMMEELGELSHAVRCRDHKIRGKEDHDANIVDACADLLIFMCDFANQEGFDLEPAVREIWQRVKKRDWKANPDTAHEEAENAARPILASKPVPKTRFSDSFGKGWFEPAIEDGKD